MKDSNTTIFQSAKQFLSGTFISRISGLLRDVAMAYAFGTSSAIAALMVAFRFAHLLRRLLGEGALQSAFIPKFEELRKESENRAAAFFSDVAATLSLTLLAIVLLSMGGAWAASCCAPLSPGAKEIFSLTLILMPSLFFICLYGLNSALLQCEKSYFLPSVAPTAFNIVWVIGTFLSFSLPPEEAMSRLAGFIVLACAGQWMMTVPQTWNFLKKHGSFPSLNGLFSREVKCLFAPLFLAVSGVAATQINSALDPLFARYADAEGPAFLWYAIRLQQLPLSLFGIALSSALLPPLARAAKREDFTAYNNFLSLALHRCILFVTPMTFAFWIAGDSCINLIYGYGDFGAESIAYTASSLAAYSFGLVPSALILVIAPAFYAKGDYRFPALSTAASVLLNIALNSLFVLILGWGAASVALATSISSWGNFFMLTARLQGGTENERFSAARSLYPMTLNILLASVAGSLLVAAADALFYGGNGMAAILMGDPLSIPTLFDQKLIRFLLEAALFALPVMIYWRTELKINIVAENGLM